MIEWRNRVLRDEAGHVNGTFSSGTDITGRNQAVEALRTAEERMRFALENADVGIWDMDYITGVVRWSGILEGPNGLQPGTFGGTFEAFIERVHPDDRQRCVRRSGTATKSGADFSTLHRSIWPDGTVRWLSGSGRILIGDLGEPCAASVFPRTSPSAAPSKSNITRLRRWRPSDGWPVAWRMTSTIC